MALAQPTGLQVQELVPQIQVEQEVQRFDPGGQVIGITQVVDDTATLDPGGEVIAIQQTVEFLREDPGGPVITLQQGVERFDAGGEVIRVRQSVLSATAAAVQPIRITLDGQDITDLCSQKVSIDGSEGDNRTATVTMVRLPKGPLNVPGFQGREVTISRLQNDALAPLFHGWVDVPRYTRMPSRLTLSCSDLRNERVGRHDQAALRQMTGGLFSPITQRDDATGQQWVGELMRTVEGSLDYTGAGVLRFRPWSLGTPRYTLTGRDVHYREAESTFATRSSVVNRIQATLEYRWFQRNTIAHAVSLSVQTGEYCKLAGCIPLTQVEDDEGNLVDQILPTRNALRSAAESVSGWVPAALEYIPLPPDGWYRKGSDVTRKSRYYASELVRNTRALGADVELERYISQAKREAYALTVEAPESIDQYGEIQGSDMRFAVESRIPPGIFEERGCSTGPADDRRADLELALQCVQRMAAKKIREGHRSNVFSFRYKPGKGRPGRGKLLPVEIGDVIAVAATEVQCTGYVVEFAHRTDEKGDLWTDINLAVSRVDSSLSVSEDWSLPAAPASYRLTPPEPGQLETPDCPAPVGGVEIEGDSRIEPDGTVIIVAPAVDRSKVDEIQGTREHTYNVAIPQNQLSVEVV